MKNRNKYNSVHLMTRNSSRLLIITLFLLILNSGYAVEKNEIKIGWATTDITPNEPVSIGGSDKAIVFDKVNDPISATILVLESIDGSRSHDMAIMISIDLVVIGDYLKNSISKSIQNTYPNINISKLVINATHTHAAPVTRLSPHRIKMLKEYGIDLPIEWSQYGMDLGIMSPLEFIDFAAERISDAVGLAWENREVGGISYGVSHAFLGQNRLTSYFDGHSQMYGKTNDFEFSHLEGYEDHSLNLLYTWGKNDSLTGVMINVAVPSQASGSKGKISANYWHETRLELKKRMGEDLYILPQVSAAGDISPVRLIDHRAQKRMQQLTGRTQREQIAINITNAVESILPIMLENIDWTPVIHHRVAEFELLRRHVSNDDIYSAKRTWHKPEVETVPQTFERLLADYIRMYNEFEEYPDLKEKADWYVPITKVYWRLMRAYDVLYKYELDRTNPSITVEVHAIRIGDIVVATNPFELYIDFGMQMKARSKAIQTFVVQLAGEGTYVPTYRAVSGGTYGAIPQSNTIGPEGGRQLVNQTLDLIEKLWSEDERDIHVSKN